MKKKIIIIVIILSILGIIFIGGSILLSTNKSTNKEAKETKEETNKTNETAVDEAAVIYQCNMKETEKEIELGGRKYSVSTKGTYSFSVAYDNAISPIEYSSYIRFNSLEDLNSYYNYLVNESKSLPEKATLEKNEENLQLKYSYPNMFYGGIEKFDDSVLRVLKEHGYECIKK